MAYLRPITAADKVFYDTDKILRFQIVEGLQTDADTLAAVVDGSATPIDVSTWTLGFTLREKVNSPDPPLIYKSTASPGGITITGLFDPVLANNTQRVEVFLHDTDTYDPSQSPVHSIKAGRYAYGLKRLDDNVEDILVYGPFVLLQAAPWE